MIMLWIMLIMGLLVAGLGIIIRSSEENIRYKQWRFDAENLSHGFVWLGSAMAASTFASIILLMGLKIFN